MTAARFRPTTSNPAERRGHQRAVVVAGRLDLDPAHHSVPRLLRLGYAAGQLAETGFVQGKLEQSHHDLALVIGDQPHRHLRANVDQHHQVPLRIHSTPRHATDPAHERRLQLAIDEPHVPTSTVTEVVTMAVCGGSNIGTVER